MTAQATAALGLAPAAAPPPSLWLVAAGPVGRGDAAGVHPSAPVRDRGHALAVRPRLRHHRRRHGPRPRRRAARRPAGRSRASAAASRSPTARCGCATTIPKAGSGSARSGSWRQDGPRTFRLSATVASDAIAGHAQRLSGRRDLAGRRRGHRAVLLPPAAPAGRAARHQARRRSMSTSSGFPSAARQVELAIRLRHATGELRVVEPAPGGAGRAALVRRGPRRACRSPGPCCWSPACWLFGRGVDHRAQRAGAGPGRRWRGRAAADARGHARQHAGAARRLSAAPAGLGRRARLARPFPDLRRRRVPPAAQPPRRPLARPAPAARRPRRAVGDCCSSWPSCARRPWTTGLTNALAACWAGCRRWLWLWWRQEGQFATQRRSSITVPPQPAKQRR